MRAVWTATLVDAGVLKMSIEEIAARTGKSTAQLFSELMSEVEVQVIGLNLLTSEQTIFRPNLEWFSLERGTVKLIVKRTRPTILTLSRLEARGFDTIPKTDQEEIELMQGAYWLNGRRFQSTKEAALFMVGKL